LEFFSKFFVHIFLQERGGLLEKRGFDTFEVINHAILDFLGHGIQILITRSINPGEKSTWVWKRNSTGLKSRFCDIFVRLSRVFHPLKSISGESANGGKILKKI